MVKGWRKLTEFPADDEHHRPDHYFERMGCTGQHNNARNDCNIYPEPDAGPPEQVVMTNKSNNYHQGERVNHDCT